MIYKGCGVEYKENGRESYLYCKKSMIMMLRYWSI